MHKFIWIPLLALCLAGAAQAEESELAPWAKIGKDMQTDAGFWNIHQDKKKTKFWIEVPGAHINKPFMMATSIVGGTTMRGWQWNDWLLVWQLKDNKLVLLERNVGYVAKGNKTLAAAVSETYTDRVLATFPIAGKGLKGGYVLDGKRFFASGASLFFGGMGRSKDASLADFKASRNFPENTEIQLTMPMAGDGRLITLHYSLSLLPKTNYKPRAADDRIGYFMTTLTDFSPENKDDRQQLRYINRWQLEKADPKLELSPPKKPIRFFIEKTVPVRFRRYVKDGILEWNKAFEKVGILDAIEVVQQTETNEHKDKHPEDIRYNFFRWIYSQNPFAMGPSRVDPRTGQILDADIIFDDAYIRFTLREYRMELKEVPAAIVPRDDMKALANHPLVRLGLIPAPDAHLDAIPADAARPDVPPHERRAFCSIGEGIRHQLGCCSLHFKTGEGEGATDKVPEELLGQFIKDTVMHEVGHTLGLRHNFKASIYRTYDEINSEAKPDDITASVMDYSPIVVAPEGKPQGNYAMRTIGPYDYWAIEYGYTAKDADLSKITSRVAEKGLDYATDEDTMSNDPYVARWDMGADPLQYARERVALMKRLRKDLEARAVDKGEGYNRLQRALNMQFYEVRNAAGIATRFIGGEQLHRDHRGDPNARPPVMPVPAAKQREALAFACEEILSGRYFDFSPDLLRKAAPDFHSGSFFPNFEYPYLGNVTRAQMGVVFGVMTPSRMRRVLDARHKTPAGEDVLTAPEVFDAFQAAIFGNLKEATARKASNQMPALSAMQRNLQREYVSHLIYMLLRGSSYPAQIQTLARYYVKALGTEIAAALEGAAGLDTYTLSHLDECKTRLERALEASYTIR